jgi:hypothetical protein
VSSPKAFLLAAAMIASPANAFEQWIEGWHLQSYELPTPFITLQTFGDKLFTVGMVCSRGDRAISAGPLEGAPDDATMSYSCDGRPPSLPVNAHGYDGYYVASKSNNIGTWSAVVAFPDTLLAAREKCSLTIYGETHELNLHGIQAAVPAYYAACAARDY